MVKNLSVITPFLNEEENINELCSVIDHYAKGKPYKIEAVFVDDGSQDQSASLIKRYKFENTKVKIIGLSKNYGSHVAIRAGIQNSTYDYCMFFSADLQEPVEIIGTMIKEINGGFDYVCARKLSSGTSWLERIFSKLYSVLIKRFAVKSFPVGGVNNIIFNKKIKQNIINHPEKNSSIFLQIISMGYKMKVIDVEYVPRKKGESKWALGKRIKLFIDSFVSFSFFPIRLVSVAGIILFFLGLLVAIVTVFLKVFGITNFTLGWPTLISLISMGFGVTNISLGIIAEYLWRDYDLSKNESLYFVDEIIEIGK